MFWKWDNYSEQDLKKKRNESFLEFSIRLKRDGFSIRAINALWLCSTTQQHVKPNSTSPSGFDDIIKSFIDKEKGSKTKPIKYAHRFYTGGMVKDK